MRISDWSSDVCSSDLHTDSLEFGLMRARARVLSSEQPGEALDYFGREINAGHNTLDNIYGLAYAQLMQSQVIAAMQTLAPLVERYQIGRAACRERVCQYG